MEQTQTKNWFEQVIAHQHLAVIVFGLVALDYLQTIVFYDDLHPQLNVFFSFRYVAIFLLFSSALAHGTRHLPYCTVALLGIDLLFYTAQSDWIVSSSDWVRVLLPFLTNISLSSCALLSVWIWMCGMLFSTAFEMIVYVAVVGIWAVHTMNQGLLDQWVNILKNWIMAFEIQGLELDQLALKMAFSMTANIVNGYILIPLLFLTILSFYFFSASKGHINIFKTQWLNYRLSWSSFAVSVMFYLFTYSMVILAYLNLGAQSNWLHSTPVFYLFDTVQFLPCVAGLSLLHAYIEHTCDIKNTSKTFWVLLLFFIFYSFYQMFVWIGLIDKVFDMRKRYQLTNIT